MNKIIFCLKILFNFKEDDLYSLKEIKNFKVTDYPMIIASKYDLNT